MRVSYSPGYVVELPPGHPFPMPKFALLHDILLAEGLIRPQDVVEPTEVPLDDLALFHTEAFIRKFATSSFDAAEVRRLGLP